MPLIRGVVGHPGYFVGDDGSVWTSKRKGGNDRTAGRYGPLRLMTVQQTPKGYRTVNLDAHGRNRSRLVHHLVLEAFVGPKPRGKEGCHYPDADKGNNRVENLRWDTHPENMRDAYRDRPAAKEKVCRRCRRSKAVSEFYADTRASDGLKTECKSCHVKVSAATRDPEKKRATNRKHMRRKRAANRGGA